MKIEIDRLDLEELEELQINSWATGEYDEEKLEVFYNKTEMCYIVSGEATIVTEFESVIVKTGDFITFPAGLECIWDVDTKIHRRYIFEEK